MTLSISVSETIQVRDLVGVIHKFLMAFVNIFFQETTEEAEEVDGVDVEVENVPDPPTLGINVSENIQTVDRPGQR
jgi:hypothetical protein